MCVVSEIMVLWISGSMNVYMCVVCMRVCVCVYVCIFLYQWSFIVLFPLDRYIPSLPLVCVRYREKAGRIDFVMARSASFSKSVCLLSRLLPPQDSNATFVMTQGPCSPMHLFSLPQMFPFCCVSSDIRSHTTVVSHLSVPPVQLVAAKPAAAQRTLASERVELV